MSKWSVQKKAGLSCLFCILKHWKTDPRIEESHDGTGGKSGVVFCCFYQMNTKNEKI